MIRLVLGCHVSIYVCFPFFQFEGGRIWRPWSLDEHIEMCQGDSKIRQPLCVLHFHVIFRRAFETMREGEESPMPKRCKMCRCSHPSRAYRGSLLKAMELWLGGFNSKPFVDINSTSSVEFAAHLISIPNFAHLCSKCNGRKQEALFSTVLSFRLRG